MGISRWLLGLPHSLVARFQEEAFQENKLSMRKLTEPPFTSHLLVSHLLKLVTWRSLETV